jgi:hypothetical protein
MNFGYNPTGPAEQKDIVNIKTGWSEFTLDDGTIVRAKAALVEAKKLVGQFTPNGEPIYLMQMSLVNEIVVPERLKKSKGNEASPPEQETDNKK